mmetsp:Transcript_39243/g.59872  ORF Transcript_39243/g.59872 Transcript_39243/m.59872 type:complete len:83 (+) Transcript_39243:88-336(+)
MSEKPEDSLESSESESGEEPSIGSSEIQTRPPSKKIVVMKEMQVKKKQPPLKKSVSSGEASQKPPKGRPKSASNPARKMTTK